MTVRKQGQSWLYDFTIPGLGRRRQRGFNTKAEALLAEKAEREAVLSGQRQITLKDAYASYLAGSSMKARGKDAVERLWVPIERELGAMFIEDVRTSEMDGFKLTLPKHLGPKSVNQYLILIGAVLRFMWKRGKLSHVPYVPREKVSKRFRDWYTQEERDQLLDGVFRLQPQWYLFFYLTCRLGLRLGEVYAVAHRQVRRRPPKLIVDQAVQRGTKTRDAILVTRKNDEAYVLDLTDDVLAAIEWHIAHGYAGEEFLFSKTGTFPRYIDSHKRPLEVVQTELGLRKLGHHAIGRHSVASQAATGGKSIKAIQAQLGHRSEQSTHAYAHLGSGAQLGVLASLQPSAPPHGTLAAPENGSSQGHGTLAAPETKRPVIEDAITGRLH